MIDQAPPMLLVTRYGKGVKDERWFRHREHLIGAITVPSLLAQTDPNFTWLIHIDADMPASARARLDEIVRPFGDRVILDTENRYNNHVLIGIGERLGMVRDGFLLTGRIDDDDAWHVDTVRIVRERAARWIARPDHPPAVVMSFALGYEWVMYRFYDLDASKKAGKTVMRDAALRPFKPVEFQGDSVFVVAPPALGVSCLAIAHGKMQGMFRDAGYEVDWMMPETPMWLYTRHKQVSTNILHGMVTPLEFRMEELARDFGFDQEGVEDYIAQADDFDYLLEKRTEHRRGLAARELREIDAAIRNGEATREMKARREELVREIDMLANNLVGSVPA